MRTITYAEANREFLPNLYTAYKKLTDEDLEITIQVAGHESRESSCRGFFLNPKTATDAMWILRGAREYEYCPRCGESNDYHKLATIRMSIEVQLVV